MPRSSPPFKTIPELETSRLILRAHKFEDLPACMAMWIDPIVTRFTTGVPSTEQRTWLRILSYVGHWSLMGFGYWAVEEKESGNFIGELGFAEFKRDIQPSIHGIPELGWALSPHAHGKGYATEALQAAVSWGDENLRTDRMVCLIKPANQPSLRVAEKLGFIQYARTENPNPSERDLLFERKIISS